MKKLFQRVIVVCFAASIALTSCEPDGDSIVTPLQPISSAEEADEFIQAVYRLMVQEILWTDAFVLMPVLFSDQAEYSGSDDDLLEASDMEMTPDNGKLDEIFTDLYNINANLSVYLGEVDTSSDESFTPELREGLSAEGRALRAFVYYYLTQYWGNVPLIESEQDLVDSLVPNSTQQELFDFMEADLLYASENISKNGFIDGDQGRLDQASVDALLARLYLTYGENQNALDAAEDAINSGISLADEYVDCFNDANIPENLFRLTESSPSQSLAIFFLPPFANGQYVVTPRTAIPFEENDARRDVALTVPGNTVLKYDDVLNNTDPVYLIRLAEAYLIAAEAAARLDDFTTASGYLNAVRDRAGLDDLTLDSDNWEDAVLRERNAELCYEGIHRLFDLRRFDKTEEALGEFGYESKDDLWPYTDRILEQFKSLDQNPGY